MTTAPAEAAIKSACCATWTHPLARLLLGDRLHPGGGRATALTLDALRLPPGARVLDLGCGYGATLQLLRERGYSGFGLDLASEALSACSPGNIVVGDAEAPPFRDGSLDGAVLECVLSLLPDKRSALVEARRVLRRGGRLAISDVTVEQSFPPLLADVATWSTCLAGACSSKAYERLLQKAEFSDVVGVTLDDELVALVEQIRRRIALIEITLRAKAIPPASVGLDRERLESFRMIATTGLDFVRDGGAGYRLFHATRG